MRIGAGLSSGTDFAAAVEDIVAYEAVGLDTVSVGESYGFDAVSAMGALAHATTTVRIAASVLGIYARTPTMTAMSVAGVDALSGGRAVLGLGTSGPQVVEGWHGVPFDAPVARTREVVQICRAVWRRDVVRHAGRNYQLPLPEGSGTGLGKPLKLMRPPARDRIPVNIAALGARNVALAAEIADGWLPVFFWPERSAQTFGPALAEGAARRHPELGPLEITASATLAIGGGATELDAVRRHVAHYVGGMGARDRNFYASLVSAYGFPGEAARVQELFLDRRRDDAAAAVPDELLEHITLIGDEEHVRRRLRAYRAAGVTDLDVTPVGETREARAAQVRRLRELVDELPPGSGR